MSTTYQTVGQAIFDLMNGIDVSAITGLPAPGWAETHNYPPKQVRSYPSFAVVPAEDAEDPMDAITDDDRVTYWVYITASYQDSSDAEDQLRRLVDLVRTRVRQQKRSATPLGGGAYALGRLGGAWGANVDQGERFYRLSIEAKVDQSLV